MVLEWINNHFSDFETDTSLSEFLEQFEVLMEKQVCLLLTCYIQCLQYHVNNTPVKTNDKEMAYVASLTYSTSGMWHVEVLGNLH